MEHKKKWIKLELIQKKLESTDKKYREAKGKKKEGLFLKLINQLIYRDKIDD
mgnify:CR=1 FL=1